MLDRLFKQQEIIKYSAKTTTNHSFQNIEILVCDKCFTHCTKGAIISKAELVSLKAREELNQKLQDKKEEKELEEIRSLIIKRLQKKKLSKEEIEKENKDFEHILPPDALKPYIYNTPSKHLERSSHVRKSEYLVAPIDPKMRTEQQEKLKKMLSSMKERQFLQGGPIPSKPKHRAESNEQQKPPIKFNKEKIREVLNLKKFTPMEFPKLPLTSVPASEGKSNPSQEATPGADRHHDPSIQARTTREYYTLKSDKLFLAKPHAHAHKKSPPLTDRATHESMQEHRPSHEKISKEHNSTTINSAYNHLKTSPSSESMPILDTSAKHPHHFVKFKKNDTSRNSSNPKLDFENSSLSLLQLNSKKHKLEKIVAPKMGYCVPTQYKLLEKYPTKLHATNVNAGKNNSPEDVFSTINSLKEVLRKENSFA